MSGKPLVTKVKEVVTEALEVEKVVTQALVVEARLEEHQGEFFLYRVDNGEFIAQGTTAQEIQDRTDKRISGQAVVVTESDDGVMERYRATKNLA